MKKNFFILLVCGFLSACSSMIPYKNQNLDYLHGIEKDPDAYRGKVVSFGGEVKGVTEDARRMRLVLKIDVPFYYYATGKDPLSYELLLISFDKKGMPQMTGIKKGSDVKVLARVANFETRKNLTGKDIAVLHLIAFALADRNRNRDFFRPEPPQRQLYESWKTGRLFFDEQPEEIEKKYPAPQRKTITFPVSPRPEAENAEPKTEKGIVFDEEEPAFILPPDPKPAPKTETSSEAAPSSEPAPASETALSSGPNESVPPEETAGAALTDATAEPLSSPDGENTAAEKTSAPAQSLSAQADAETEPTESQTGDIAAPGMTKEEHQANTPAIPGTAEADSQTGVLTPSEENKLLPQPNGETTVPQALQPGAI